jgi:hypothetical protein
VSRGSRPRTATGAATPFHVDRRVSCAHRARLTAPRQPRTRQGIKESRRGVRGVHPAEEGRDRGDEGSCVHRLGDMELEARGERLSAVLLAREGGQRGRKDGRGACRPQRLDSPDQLVAVVGSG